MKRGESKNNAFKRLAANRTNAVIHNLHLLGNLSNKHNYNYSDEDYRKIFGHIDEELKLAKSRFLVSLNKKKKFKL